MSRELRHIILITLLAIAMTGCTDSPAPAPAPAPQRPLCFTASPAVIYPVSRASRADAETEEITLFEGEQIYGGDWAMDKALKFESTQFTAHKPVAGTSMKVYVKDVTNPSSNVEFYNGYSSKIYECQITEGTDYHQLTLTEEIISQIQTSGIQILTFNRTVTKVTYTALKSTGTDPENPGATGGLTYDGLNTTFNEGSLIGCVIAKANAAGSAKPYTYLANSCWTWRSAGLKLTKLFDPDNNQLDIADNTIIRHFTADELAAIDGAEADPAAPYYIKLLDPAADYAFFFYYPYIDETILTEAATKAGGSADNYPYIINNNISDTQTRIVASKESSSTYQYASWTDYPIIPHNDFTKGSSQERLENSDFMHAIVTTTRNGDPINDANASGIGDIPVVLNKKMVTIDLLFAEEPRQGSVKIIPKKKDQYDHETYGMDRIYDYDISTGKFIKAHDFTEWGAPFMNQNAKYRDDIYPRYTGTVKDLLKTTDADGKTVWQETDFHCYRVIVPPQTKGELGYRLSFTVNATGATQTLNDIQRNPLLAELKSGYYYRLRFSKTGDETGWHIDIDDWKQGGDIILNRPD